jgi:CheY-like chemotaxis protein
LVFEAFHQQTGQDSREYGGTGLGLTITKRLVENMNGSISLVSVKGLGSEFRVCFEDVEPANPPAPQSEPEISEYNVSFEPGVVIVADDVDFNRELIAEHLAGSGLEILMAENGAELLALARVRKPNLMIIDMKMPGLSGDQVAEELKRIPELSGVPRIAYSGAFLEDSMVNLFDGCLMKPFEKRELFVLLNKYFRPVRTNPLQMQSINAVSAKAEAEVLNVDNSKSFAELEGALMKTCRELVSLVKIKAGEEFSDRVGSIAD